ncbi:MAG: hypothetical protein ACI4RD_00355 [Kiritimatiellia bacterium]
MKYKLLVLILAFTLRDANATAYFDNITNLWYTAQFSNVLAIANERLSSDTNDIAGLLLKASYDVSFHEATVVSNSLLRVLEVGQNVASPAFSNVFQITKIDANGILRYMSLRNNDQKQDDWTKEAQPGLDIHHIHELKALDDDGYFDEHQ